jgi:4-carboxymuconolactone decarboxylase
METKTGSRVSYEWIALSITTIGASSALRSEHCLDIHVKGAQRLGTIVDQIFLAMLLGVSVAETTALPKSLRVWHP